MLTYALHTALLAGAGFFGLAAAHGVRPGWQVFYLGAGGLIGLGCASLAAHLFLLAGLPPGKWILAVDAALFTICATPCLTGRQVGRLRPGALPATPGLAMLLLVALAATLLALLQATTPHGLWDAWAIWNQRARYLFRHPAPLAAPLHPAICHGDYPLLLPHLVAWGWAAWGRETVLVPCSLAILATLAPAAMLYGFFQGRGTPGRGALAAACYLGTPYVLWIGADQLADLELAGFVLAAVACLHLADEREPAGGAPGLRFAAGLAAGLAAWTKNEGLVFALALAICRLAGPDRKGRAPLFLLGMAVPLSVVADFKLTLAPATDLWTGRTPAELAAKLTDVARHWQVGRTLFAGMLTGLPYGPAVGLPPILAAAAACLGIRWRTPGGAPVWLAMVLAVMVGAYHLVFVLSPHDLTWHLDTAAMRILLHLYPAAILLYFLVVRDPPRSPAPAPDASART